MSGGPTVVTVGHVTHDLYPGGIIEPGGCAYYGALVHAALGGDVRLVTAVGEDFSCDGTVEPVLHAARREGQTTCFRNLYREGRPRVQRVDALAPEVLAPVDPPFPADVLHLAPVLGEVDLARWYAAGPTTLRALNIQGWIKRAGPAFATAHPGLEDHGPPGARAVLQHPWRPEAEHLAGFQVACVGREDLFEQDGLLDHLLAHVPVVTCTFGAEGSDVHHRGEVTRVGIHPATEVDPTGAGDCFAAGLVHGLAIGLDPVEAARLGAAVASIIVEDVGARAMGRVATEARTRAARVPVG